MERKRARTHQMGEHELTRTEIERERGRETESVREREIERERGREKESVKERHRWRGGERET